MASQQHEIGYVGEIYLNPPGKLEAGMWHIRNHFLLPPDMSLSKNDFKQKLSILRYYKCAQLLYVLVVLY